MEVGNSSASDFHGEGETKPMDVVSNGELNFVDDSLTQNEKRKKIVKNGKGRNNFNN